MGGAKMGGAKMGRILIEIGSMGRILIEVGSTEKNLAIEIARFWR